MKRENEVGNLLETDKASLFWHGEVLAERDRLIESGEEEFVNWEIAKRQLHEELGA